MDIKELLFSLSRLNTIGNIDEASFFTDDCLSKYCTVTKKGNTIIGEIKGDSDYTVLIDAHIDQIGFIVTDISKDGFLTVAKCGGIDLRHLPAKRVKIHGKKTLDGVFVSTPPHLEQNDLVPEISDCKIDTGLGNKAKEFVSVGDIVVFANLPFEMSNNTVCGKSFDNRAGVACILELAKRLSTKKLPFNVTFLLSDAEELGLRGAVTSAYSITADEAIVIDVSFGNGPDISGDKCGFLGKGAMLGISPVLCRDISDRLCDIAFDNNIPYQTEVMGDKTSTNADMISISKFGIPSGLVSIPLRNMHTDVEVVCLDDIISVCDIVENYLLSGGIYNV